MNFAWPSVARKKPLNSDFAPVQSVTSFQKITVEMPMMTPGVSTGETTTR